MKTIGIKLADGSFFPVLQEGQPAEKTFDLTTAHNNQTRVMVDLYRSSEGTMDDAEYVDTLQIDNLVAHPNGEPDISFVVSIDENNELSAKIADPETGATSDVSIELVNRTLEERLASEAENPEFSISPTQDFSAGDINLDDSSDNLGLPEMGEMPSDEMSLDETVAESQEPAFEDNFVIEEQEPIIEESSLADVPLDDNPLADLPDFETETESPAMDFDLANDKDLEEEIENEDVMLGITPASAGLGDMDSYTNIENIDDGVVVDDSAADSTPVDAPYADNPLAEMEMPSDMPLSDTDTEDSFVSEEPASEDTGDDPLAGLPDFDESPASDEPITESTDNPLDGLPDFDETPATEESADDATFAGTPLDDTSLGDDSLGTDPLSDSLGDDTTFAEDTDLPDFNTDTTDPFATEEPASEESASEDTGDDPLAGLPDFDESPSSDEPITESTDNPLDGLPDFDETPATEEPADDATFAETPLDDTALGDDSLGTDPLAGLPDFDETPAESTESSSVMEADLPDFNFSDDTFSSDTSLGDDSFGGTNPFADDSFADTTSTDYSVDDNDILDWDTPAPAATQSNSNGGISFTGLYDKETELGEPESNSASKKTTAHVVICSICAIICVAAVLLLLFVIPSGINLLGKNQNAQKEAEPPVVTTLPEQPKPASEPEPAPKAEVAQVPAAKEDEIIIIEEAEVVVPEPPAPPKEEPKDIEYKVRWGDTLWDIADTYYKNPWKYKAIAKYNGIKDPDYIISGTIILIPQE